jgi:hypothetical protein
MQHILDQADHYILGKKVRVTKADREKKGTKKINTRTLLVRRRGPVPEIIPIIDFFSWFGAIDRVETLPQANFWQIEESILIHYMESASVSNATKSLDPHVIDGVPLECFPVENNEEGILEDTYEDFTPYSYERTHLNMSLNRQLPQNCWTMVSPDMPFWKKVLSTEEYTQDPEILKQPPLLYYHSSVSEEIWAGLSSSGTEATRSRGRKRDLNYVHIVEFETDELYRIFCAPKVQKRQSICNSQLQLRCGSNLQRKTSSNSPSRSETGCHRHDRPEK